MQLFQEDARTPAAAAAGQEQHGTASPAAQAILSAISGGAKAPAQQQQRQQQVGAGCWLVAAPVCVTERSKQPYQSAYLWHTCTHATLCCPVLLLAAAAGLLSCASTTADAGSQCDRTPVPTDAAASSTGRCARGAVVGGPRPAYLFLPFVHAWVWLVTGGRRWCRSEVSNAAQPGLC